MNYSIWAYPIFKQTYNVISNYVQIIQFTTGIAWN